MGAVTISAHETEVTPHALQEGAAHNRCDHSSAFFYRPCPLTLALTSALLEGGGGSSYFHSSKASVGIIMIIYDL